MSLYVSVNGKQIGPFEEDAVLAHLASGMLSVSDMAIRQGDASWSRLGDIFANRLPVRSQVSAPSQAPNAAAGARSPNWARVFLGCYISMVLFWLSGIGILSVIGLLTGYFHVPARSGPGLDLYGTWARVASALALALVTWALFVYIKKLRKLIVS